MKYYILDQLIHMVLLIFFIKHQINFYPYNKFLQITFHVLINLMPKHQLLNHINHL